MMFLLVLLGVSLFLHFKFRPVIKAISVSKAKVISTEAVNEAILQELSENKEAYNQIVKLEKLENDSRVLAMSEYPYYGSVQKIDDYIVVKLG